MAHGRPGQPAAAAQAEGPYKEPGRSPEATRGRRRAAGGSRAKRGMQQHWRIYHSRRKRFKKILTITRARAIMENEQKDKDSTAAAGEGAGVKEYRPTEGDNLFTAYMDYLHFMDRYRRPAADPQPAPTLTAEQRADLDREISAALQAFTEAQKGGK